MNCIVCNHSMSLHCMNSTPWDKFMGWRRGHCMDKNCTCEKFSFKTFRWKHTIKQRLRI